MRIALIGATGNIGTEIAKEALGRGHEVTAIVRNVDKVPAQAGLTARQGDVNDRAVLAETLRGHDVVASSVHFTDVDAATLIGAVRDAGVPRLAVVGGAGSLLLPDGGRVIDSPDFPEAYKPEALGGAGVPRSPPTHPGPRLDVPVALGGYRSGRAHGPVPARGRPSARGRGRAEPNLAGRLRHRVRR